MEKHGLILVLIFVLVNADITFHTHAEIESSLPMQRDKRQIIDPTAAATWVMPTLGSTPKSRVRGQRGKERERVRDRASESQEHTQHLTQQNEDTFPNVMIQRLNERLLAISSIGEQQLRRLESLEYRLTKLEVMGQEKAEAVRSVVSEIGRKVENVDWDMSKMETLLEVMRQDLINLRQGQSEIRTIIGTNEAKKSQQQSEISYTTTDDFISKMQMMMTTLYGLRGMLGAVNDDLSATFKNMSIVVNHTSSLRSLADNLVTKQYLRTVLTDIDRTSKPPMQAVPHFLQYMPAVSVKQEIKYPIDCNEVKLKGNNLTGIYMLQPNYASEPFFAVCDMETDGGGWLVFHNRYEGTVDFFREWNDYKYGFGNLGGEFWLGLEKLYLFTNQQVYELYVALEDFNLQTAYATYTAFAIGSELEGYAIKLLGAYDGDAGDSLVYHASMKFSTRDVDNDQWPDGNCAMSHSGAWWYNGCDTSNLNGQYLNGNLPQSYEYQGMYWYDYHGPSYSLLKAKMMIRPRQNTFLQVTEKDKETNAKQGYKARTKEKPKPLEPHGDIHSDNYLYVDSDTEE